MDFGNLNTFFQRCSDVAITPGERRIKGGGTPAERTAKEEPLDLRQEKLCCHIKRITTTLEECDSLTKTTELK